MMNERVAERKLHKLYILFPLAESLKPLIPAALLLLSRFLGEDSLRPVHYFWFTSAAAAVSLLLLGYGWLRWDRFIYVLEDDKIMVRRGIFFREELAVYTGRIHSMNMEQPLLQRLLGLTQVQIDTPGKSEEGCKLPAVSRAEAEHLQRWLRERTRSGGTQQASSVSTGASKEPGDNISSGETGSLEHIDDSPDPVLAAEIINMKDTETAAVPSDQACSTDTSVQSEERAVLLHISAGRLLVASLTSFNLSLAAAFIAGALSFADRILPDQMYSQLYQEAEKITSWGWAAAAAIGVVLAWILSAVLYTVKYAGFTVERVGKQIAITCGLLDRKQMFFSPKRVQSVTVKESVLRQPFGYGEVKLHVHTSDSDQNLVLHPMVRLSEVEELLHKIVPQFSVVSVDARSPKRALHLSLQFDFILTSMVCAGIIWLFKLPGLWSLLLLPLSLFWTYLTHREAGIALQGKQLTMRSRVIARHTRYVRRPQILSLTASGSRRFRKHKLRSLNVNIISSSFDGKVDHLDEKDVERIWKWYRQRPSE